MKVRVPVLVKDSEVIAHKGGLPLAEDFVIEGEDVLLDGPVCRRLAVLDFDPKSGALVRGARFSPPEAGSEVASYERPRGDTLDDPAFVQAAVFGGVYKTLATFEEPDALGRRVDWAFDGPQLLVVPRAGEWANAFYERDSRSIQLFYFSPDGGERVVYTAHSQDIIAHETAHAIIDGVAPDLYHASHPQALGLHEALADIATLLMAFRSRKLAARVLAQTGGSLDRPSAFTAIAGELGRALGENRHSLRELLNDRKLDPESADPHALSEVLSGALYSVMRQMYGALRRPAAAAPEPRVAVKAEYEQYSRERERIDVGHTDDDFRALFIASERFKRMVLRGLDYLPPGEVTFADFGRAVLASDQASHPDATQPREWLCQELVSRGVVGAFSDLAVQTSFEHKALGKLDLDELVASDWLAYRFANENRTLLGIPPKVPFEVRPRLDVSKLYYHEGEEPESVRECLFKVSWTEIEPCRAGGGLPQKRRVARGTTLAIDWAKKSVRALLTGEAGGAEARDRMLRALLDRGELALGTAALAADKKPLRGVIPGEVADGILRLRSTARALHVTRSR